MDSESNDLIGDPEWVGAARLLVKLRFLHEE